MTNRRVPILGLFLILALVSSGRVGAEDRCYAIIFGSQTTPFRLQLTHTFATFVKVADGGPEPCLLEAHTISWLPETLDVRLVRLLPEPGANLDLDSTLRLATAHGAGIVRWGPYPIDPELYRRAMVQIAHLQSGEVKYKAIDSGYSTESASNCIHAVADLAGQRRLRIATPGWGFFASCACVSKLRPWILDTAGDHEWVADKLGLYAYPIERRDLHVKPRIISLLGSRSALFRPWKP